ncbi:MAG: glycoside hydrolase [Nitrospirae bacterium]|nr:glycoside hydrolase [Nitrospirota bacterium]
MGAKKLSIAFLWHMHQPYYKDPFTSVYRLPWVRLHGVKDYLDMLSILNEFPAIRQTFNLVPSLLAQLADYTDNGAMDTYLAVTLKSPSDLSEAEKQFIIGNFFYANWDTMIKPYPRYYELLVKRGFRFTKSDILRASRYFDEHDIRDLQVLFNLAWIDPMFKNSDPFLLGLIKKGKDFTEEDKHLLIDKQMEILRRIIPEYKRMGDSGQVELSVTPFYHPILPLLWDTNSARIAMPQVNLPKKRFSHPEDAVKQIEMAVSYFDRVFGRKPAGMWPSEGSVSEDVVRAIGNAGIKWIATDEEVLARSLNRSFRSPEGYLTDAATLYRMHQFSGVSMLFRDHRLSDLIGFTYSGWNAEKAVADFIGKLADIRNSLPGDRPYLVPVILDGENAWEYFVNDGHDFLAGLYRALSNDDRFRTVTVSDFINEQGAGDTLHRLHAGSWINANFGIWLGHEEDNMAWDYLSQTRDDLESFARANPTVDLSEAWTSVYAAEGSDWNWWYGDEHTTETQEDFDELFRNHLMKVYKVMGKDVPPQLHIPILIEDRSIVPVTQARGFIRPKIDGTETSYYEWNQAAFIDVKRSGGSMHRSESIIASLHYGFDKDNFYLRIDPKVPFAEMQEKNIIHVDIVKPFTFRIVFDIGKGQNGAVLYEKINEEWKEVKSLQDAAAVDIFELGIPFSDLKSKENDEINFSIDIMRNGDEVERCPWRGYITVTVPSPYYETIMWY